MKRSTCASGSGYVPSDSIGFCVAMTRNGDGTACVSLPIVTCRSCITSSSADCTLAGARLISSARRKLQKTGPSSVSKPSLPPRYMRVPTRSEGTRSGVNCTRWKRSAEHVGHRLDRQRLRQAGHALDQEVPARQQADEDALEHLVLARDHALDLEEGALDHVSVGAALESLSVPAVPCSLLASGLVGGVQTSGAT